MGEDYSNVDSPSSSPAHLPTEHSRSASYGGAIFSGSHHFAVVGGTFTSITKNYARAPTMPSNLRIIPLGDIDLQHEMHVNYDTGVVDRGNERQARVRRVYSARLEGRQSNMTVAIYQGDGSEQEWKHDIARYIHPNIIQICGAASSGNIYATLFHDDLIPFRHFLNLYRYSPMLTIYIYAYSNADFGVVCNYVDSVVSRHLYSEDCTFWIRRSTGRLCAELIQASEPILLDSDYGILVTQGISALSAPNTEGMAIESLTLEEYHHICFWNLSPYRSITASLPTTVNLGVVICCSSRNELEDSVEIATLPNVEGYRYRWESPGAVGEIVEDGWTRFESSIVLNSTITMCTWTLSTQCETSWLSQANRIFSHFDITSNLEDYVLIDDVAFRLVVGTTNDLPLGFLFLCPEEDFRAGPSSFRWPDYPAYWSHDPSGAVRLSAVEAARQGFPPIQLTIEVYGHGWDAGVYAGIRQFHQVDEDAEEDQEDPDEVNKNKESELTHEDSTHNVIQIPTKRPLEDSPTGNTVEQTPECATLQVQGDLALRRLMLDEKAQLIEMLRLGMFTENEFKAQLAQIEARCQVATQPSPAKRPRLANSSGVGSLRDVQSI
ncbi:hypothetical protein MVEN_02335900 [Mycena venus]|uniref:Uncharacterized protein n=1 Tax=Mycena venus TaxID=2733690 RepID=A0A8H7CES5_9AGAR|nr:hypothetical protein MVEN_02335900 [Mycena venus]